MKKLYLVIKLLKNLLVVNISNVILNISFYVINVIMNIVEYT